MCGPSLTLSHHNMQLTNCGPSQTVPANSMAKRHDDGRQLSHISHGVRKILAAKPWLSGWLITRNHPPCQPGIKTPWRGKKWKRTVLLYVFSIQSIFSHLISIKSGCLKKVNQLKLPPFCTRWCPIVDLLNGDHKIS